MWQIYVFLTVIYLSFQNGCSHLNSNPMGLTNQTKAQTSSGRTRLLHALRIAFWVISENLARWTAMFGLMARQTEIISNPIFSPSRSPSVHMIRAVLNITGQLVISSLHFLINPSNLTKNSNMKFSLIPLTMTTANLLFQRSLDVFVILWTIRLNWSVEKR